jgi:hypothetical protein
MSRSFRKTDRRDSNDDFDPFLARKAERNRRAARNRKDFLVEDTIDPYWR